MEEDYRRVVVTGGAGFIGSQLTRRLLQEGFEVKVIDNLSFGSIKNIEDFKDNKNFIFVKGDVRDFPLVKEVCKGADAVFHEAAVISTSISINQPELVNDVNIKGTLNILQAAAMLDIKKIILASSCAVYGDSSQLPCTEGLECNPLSNYAVTKLAAEKYCKVYSEIHGLRAVVLRYFNVYGPSWSMSGEETAVRSFISRLIKGKSPTIYGDGHQTRDFVHVLDVIEANMKSLEYRDRPFRTFNVGIGEPIKIIDLAEKLIKIFGIQDLKAVFAKYRVGEIKYSYADLRRVNRELGYKPTLNLDKGLNLTVEWYLKNRVNAC